jgi:hypothetical protein
MRYYPSILSLLGVALAVVTVTSAARAADTAANGARADSSEGYAYAFSDDVMQAGAFTPNEPRIVIVTRAQRVSLIRPRTAFVVAMLRSVESL